MTETIPEKKLGRLEKLKNIFKRKKTNVADKSKFSTQANKSDLS